MATTTAFDTYIFYTIFMNLSSEIFEHLFTTGYFLGTRIFAAHKSHHFLIHVAQSAGLLFVSYADIVVQNAVFAADFFM